MPGIPRGEIVIRKRRDPVWREPLYRFTTRARLQPCRTRNVARSAAMRTSVRPALAVLSIIPRQLGRATLPSWFTADIAPPFVGVAGRAGRGAGWRHEELAGLVAVGSESGKRGLPATDAHCLCRAAAGSESGGIGGHSGDRMRPASHSAAPSLRSQPYIAARSGAVTRHVSGAGPPTDRGPPLSGQTGAADPACTDPGAVSPLERLSRRSPSHPPVPVSVARNPVRLRVARRRAHPGRLCPAGADALPSACGPLPKYGLALPHSAGCSWYH